MLPLFFNLKQTLIRSFSGSFFLIHLLAWALTAILVFTGADWQYFLATRTHNLSIFFFPAVIIGAFLPIFGPLFLLLLGYLKQNPLLKRNAWAIGQAALLGFLIAALYKALTGRLQPNLLDPSLDVSHVFRFGFLRGGIFWGWPSSHTTIACAMAMTTAWLYRKSRVIPLLSALYALYIGIGVATVGIHWLSEAVAGALIGTVIGLCVALQFAKKTPSSG